MPPFIKLYALIVCFLFSTVTLPGQTNVVMYAGGAGKETFYDLLQITDGSFLIAGYAENLDWINDTIPRIELTYNGAIPNSQGSGRYGILLHVSSDLAQLLHVVHFPKGAVEDIRFIKTNSRPYQPVSDLFISCNTADSDANDGGYIIAKLKDNFIHGIPDALDWVHVVWAKSVPKENHPWDVTNDGRIYYITGEAYAYDWSAVYCIGTNGQRIRVNNWRTHWLTNGSEWRGTPAAANPLGSADSVRFSGIVLKAWGRCDLRSWNWSDYQAVLPDGNGGTKKGKWPLDILFNSPCDPLSPVTNSPGYTGYSLSGTPVYGGQSILVDRRNNDLYIGMNFKSVLPDGQPDFEPAIIAMDSTGEMRWWSRLYHEISPDGDTLNSTPDQYIDALALDYAHDQLVVGARCHGNNVENFWEGNTIDAHPEAKGFQNNFTGNSGNIHISWIGKLALSDGMFTHSTYMAELAEGTSGLGTPHSDPNLDGWPDPNSGWPNVNTTRLARNNMKVTSAGDVVVAATGRRTITTANAYQKMVKPYYGGLSTWNSFVRVYDATLSVPKYSSLVVGVWDTLTQSGGGNTELFGVYKTAEGVIGVGRQTADNAGLPQGNNLPVINVPAWANSTPEQESAILVYYKAANLFDSNDQIPNTSSTKTIVSEKNKAILSPNPNNGTFYIAFEEKNATDVTIAYSVYSNIGQLLQSGYCRENIPVDTELPKGFYIVEFRFEGRQLRQKMVISDGRL